ncbi:hypothetical protein [Rheinheimera sp. WS51]|uniref:hypothetical protein n=1 Tax=Rheinheimera sp. WS51 TaxID=3425886 RepID=UPI003D8A393E
MLTILSLTGLLASPLYSANGYSPSERRTLQTAVEMSIQYNELERFQQHCISQEPESDIAKIYSTLPVSQAKAYSLIENKLKMSGIESVESVDKKLTKFVKKNVPTLIDCTDSKAYQTLLDSYELTVFSLEISSELAQAPVSTATSRQQSAASETASIKKLIESSHGIALVTVTDRNLLSPVEQANYLHLDYDSRYIFKVHQGWKNITASYMGMHIAVDDASLASTATEWLIFIDQKKHFIKAIKKQDAAAHLRMLVKPEWMFDTKGNLVRL